MKVLRFLLDNWWLLIFGYGLWRSVTKRGAAQRRLAAEQREAPRTPEESPSMSEHADLSDQSDRYEPVAPREEFKEEGRIYTFDSPVAAEEERDAVEEEKDAARRLAAFAFVPTESAASLAATESRRELREHLERAYGPSGEPLRTLDDRREPSVTAAELRRAIILSEILLPPRAVRRLR